MLLGHPPCQPIRIAAAHTSILAKREARTFALDIDERTDRDSPLALLATASRLMGRPHQHRPFTETELQRESFLAHRLEHSDSGLIQEAHSKGTARQLSAPCSARWRTSTKRGVLATFPSRRSTTHPLWTTAKRSPWRGC